MGNTNETPISFICWLTLQFTQKRGNQYITRDYIKTDITVILSVLTDGRKLKSSATTNRNILPKETHAQWNYINMQ
jgi:hypothetical protein